MPVNFEIKGSLARLLATEDLVVEHKKVQTACFNVHTRVLTLPMWEKASNVVYDLLVGHEVGHALYTPDENWLKEYKISPDFVNVVEDTRIEKLMKRRYPGLAKTFFNGYKELAEQDFFKIQNEDISKMNLADRVNLRFKIGNYVQVPIESGEETEIINLIDNVETFADVLIASEALYKYCKKNLEDSLESLPICLNDHDMPQSIFDFDNQEDDDEEDDGEDEEDQNQNDGKGGGDWYEEDKDNDDEEDNGEEEEPEVKTMDSFEEALKYLIGHDPIENVYLELPTLDLKKIIIPNQNIHDNCKKTWDEYLQRTEYTPEYVFGEVDKQFFEFKRSAQREVTYMVKEFECRKAADSYSRSSIACSGVLNCSKLHTYKYNEDLFKKVTTLPDSKNHGLVFVLDWSGSMNDVMLDTVKQLFNLIWFCKKVAIPFEVYAFTNDYPIASYDENGKAVLRESFYEKKEGIVHISEWFSMMNLFTSKVNAKTLEDQMKNIYRIATYFSKDYVTFYDLPRCLSLSGTPLNDALITLHQILPKFKKENDLQKVHCVVLTDGESCASKYHIKVQRNWETEPYIGTSYFGSNVFLRDRKTGSTYSCNNGTDSFTNNLLLNLRNNFTDISFIGVRVLESRDAGAFIRLYCGYYGTEHDKTMNTWKKEKSFTIKTSGYHAYFGLSANALSQNSEFEVAESATKTQIKSAFVKSLKSKKMNKRILSEFIELIA